MRARIVDAAVRVLTDEGALGFTTTKVADEAGISVGSLYQYFPNKAAILFRLQRDEWRQTAALLRDLLSDDRRPPLERLRAVVHAFVQSECDEAAVRVALDDAAPLYRSAPEAREVRADSEAAIDAFMREALPGASEAARTLAGELVMTTLSAVAKQFSEEPHAPQEISAYAAALAEMLCAYLAALARRGR